jgi:hypothetical protein
MGVLKRPMPMHSMQPPPRRAAMARFNPWPSATSQTPNGLELWPLNVIPLDAAMGPDEAFHARRATMHCGGDEVRIDLGALSDMADAMVINAFAPGRSLLCYLEHRQQGALSLAVTVAAPILRQADRWQLVAKLGGQAETLIASEGIRPMLQWRSIDFEFDVSEASLQRWQRLGVLQSFIADRVQLCPKCCGVPTVRHGCRRCGSVRVDIDELLHHFACAHVDFRDQFVQESGNVTCPACAKSSLVLGTDYEQLIGANRCHACGWEDSKLEWVGECLQCRFRFPMHQARTLELRGYRADRLDLLAFQPTT